MAEEQNAPAFVQEIQQMREELSQPELARALEQRLARAAEEGGTATPEYAVTANELGALYRATARYAQGEQAFKLALASIEALEGRSDRYATCLDNLAELYRLDGRLDECEQALEQAEALFTDHASDEYAACLNYQGHAAMVRGRFDDAAALYERSGVITQANQTGTIEVATAFQNVANAYMQAGRLPQADAALKRALAVYDEYGLPVNSHYVGLLNTLAVNAFRQGEVQAAADWMKRAEDALARCNVSPLDAAVMLANAAAVFVKAGFGEDARRAAERARSLVADNGLEGNPQAQRVIAAIESF